MNAFDYLSQAMGIHLRMEEYNNSLLNWFVTFRNPLDPEHGQLYHQPSFFFNELEYYIIGMLTFVHAWKNGGNYLWFWFAIVGHGITVELISYWLQDIDNFWHSQAMFTFFGQREPLQIFLLYPTFIYTSTIAVSRLRIPELCEGPAIALLIVLLDLPYDIMGIKMLWWTWHDTDSNIRDRNYWVPWTSYYFHMTFACAFTLLYNFSRRHLTGFSGLYRRGELVRMPIDVQTKAKSFKRKFLALLIASLFSMPFGICQFVPIYHWGHDIFGLHAEFCTMFLVAIYASIAFYGIMHRSPLKIIEYGQEGTSPGTVRQGKGRWYHDTVYWGVLLHYCSYMILVLVANPESLQIYGLHQPMGSAPGSTDSFACDQKVFLTYPYPFTEAASWPFDNPILFENVTVWKRPYICEDELFFDEGVFGFHCDKAKNQVWKPGNQMYWICGTDFTNKDSGTTRFEYIFLIFGICLLGMNVFTMIMYSPQSLFSQLFFHRRLPRYYKID